MFRIQDLIISPKSLGSELLLVDVSPAFAYKDNRRTDTVTGYRYTVCAMEKGMEKINVKIDGPQLMEKPDSYVKVRFEGLEVFVYWANGNYNVGARATGISLANKT